MKIPFFNFEGSHGFISEEMNRAFRKVYHSNWLILGEELKAFESDYARFNGVNYCAGVSSGLDAICLSLRALGVGPGDEVIVPSNTFIATVLAVSHLGATPVFVEPDISTYNLNPRLLEASITAKTKVIIPVHLYGQSCRMDLIEAICQRHKLSLLEDNAQDHGAQYAGKLTGSWGDINATSFYPGKNLGALGDGGGVTTNNELLYQKVLSLRNYGSHEKYRHDSIGYNARLDELQAAFLSVKLRYLPHYTAQRQEIANQYLEGLNGVGDLLLPKLEKDATHVYHLFVIRTARRNELQEFLHEQGVGTLIHYPIPPHLQGAFAYLGYQKGDFPIAELISQTCLSLPVWPGMGTDDVAYVISKIHRFFHGF
jgi:dTDP-4-amino-4,6-dideoxygalactose transaminase